MRLIHVLFTGGTISMRHDASAGGNVPQLGGDALLALAPGIAGIAQCRVEDWARKPACHLGQADMWRLRERVHELTADPAVHGIVITHGTDTMEETAYLLDRTLDPRVPVVLTGAMRTSDAPDWDGARNLTDAVRVAASPAAVGRGVLIAFAGRVWQGTQAVKVDTVAVESFGAPHGAPVGNCEASGVKFVPKERHASRIAPKALTARVALVPMIVGDDGAMLDAVRATCDGVVIESFGSGNCPPGAVPAMQRWLEAGKPVILASRCAGGVVVPSYAFEGGGARTVAMGAIPAGPRTASQARWELTIALSAGVRYAEGEPA